jgi:DNA repair protein RecO (recombination protein O)
MMLKTEGIVIRTKTYGEGNLILTVLTKELGKLGIMARGAKKTKSRLSSISQLFTHGHYLIMQSSPRSMGTLSQGEVVQSFRHIRGSLDKTAYASYFAELIDKSFEDKEASQGLFDMTLAFFQYIEEDKDPEILARLFEIKICMLSGYRPVLDMCTSCGTMDELAFFSIKEGGLLCHTCQAKERDKVLLSAPAARLLTLFFQLDYRRVGQINVKQETKDELKKILWLFMDYHTPLRIKSRGFLEQLDKL